MAIDKGKCTTKGAFQKMGFIQKNASILLLIYIKKAHELLALFL